MERRRIHRKSRQAGIFRRNLLRWGELAALRRGSIDLDACEIPITETAAELDKGALVAETPKSRAGRRTVVFPADLVPELRWHLEQFAEPGERGLVFIGPKGAPLRRSNFGHSSTRAAMIYQHATRDRDQVIAKALGGLARKARGKRKKRQRKTGDE
jgi:integrase